MNDDQYMFEADLLNKFHTAPEWIQALIVIALPLAVVLCVWMIVWCMRMISRDVMLRAKNPTDPPLSGRLLYSIYRDKDHDGILIYTHGESGAKPRRLDDLLFLPKAKKDSSEDNNDAKKE